jgi:ligand-binding sensor domain-containing protein
MQDQKGFLWVATENGVSRFDGNVFHNYSLKDGLADNEIFKICEDKTGRIWFMGFTGKLSIFHNGIFFNARNLELLKTLNFNYYIKDFFQDSGETIWISSSEEGVKALTRSGRIYEIDSPDGKYDNLTDFFCRGDSVFAENKNYQVVFVKFKARIIRAKSEKEDSDKPLCSIKDSKGTSWTGKKDGLYSVSTFRKIRHLDNVSVTSVHEDSEGNIWVSTLGQGLYMLPVIPFYSPSSQFSDPVFAVTATSEHIISGTGRGSVRFMKSEGVIDKEVFLNGVSDGNKVRTLYPDRSGSTWCGTDNGIFRISSHGKVAIIQKGCSVKDFCYFRDYLWFATNSGIFRVHEDSSRGKFISSERVISVSSNIKTIISGGLQGFSEIDSGRNILTDYRISRLHTSGRIILAGTYGAGLYMGTPGEMKMQLVTGLSGDVIMDIVKGKGNVYFVATERGIDKIELDGNYVKSILSFSESDGLPTEEINSLFYRNDTLFIASDKGVIFFNPSGNPENAAFPKIYITEMMVNNLRVNTHGNLYFESDRNNIKFQFTGIAYSSFGDVKYEYILKGLENGWTETGNKSVEYRGLAPGHYEFCVRAISKYGDKSKYVANTSFEINPPVYSLWWFRIIAGSVIGGFIYSAGFLIIRRNKKRNNEKLRLLELEQSALQSQMNPHFLFNSINSIQQFLILSDKRSSLKYLTTFANLMRNFLSSMQMKYVSLEQEISNIKLYVELENLRLNNKFDLKIDYADLPLSDIFIPSMFIQPVVENCILHGLAPLENRQAILSLIFKADNQSVKISVKDNGIGRDASKAIEGKRVYHTGSAVRNMDERIRILNKIKGFKADFQINDLFDIEGKPIGTEVVLVLPRLNYRYSDKGSHN